MKKINLIIIAFMTAIITGCVSTKSLSNLHTLPTGTPYYTGSFLYDPWVYMGSKDNYHYFRYSYPKDSWLRTISFRIPKEQLNLEFERPYSRETTNHVAVTPVRKSDQVVAFDRTTSIFERVMSPNPIIVKEGTEQPPY
jgi:hypothetical protein